LAVALGRRTFVHSDGDHPVTLSLRSDEGVRVWLNGERVFDHEGFLSNGTGSLIQMPLSALAEALLSMARGDERALTPADCLKASSVPASLAYGLGCRHGPTEADEITERLLHYTPPLEELPAAPVHLWCSCR
jgi:hypothetical protein